MLTIFDCLNVQLQKIKKPCIIVIDFLLIVVDWCSKMDLKASPPNPAKFLLNVLTLTKVESRYSRMDRVIFY